MSGDMNNKMPYRNSKNSSENKRNSKAQVWIETVIYTLIGLVVITIIISVATPQIDKIKDRGIVTNMFGILGELDSKISEVTQAEGSVRNIQIAMSKGFIEIDSSDDSIRYTLENTRLELSEPGEELMDSGIKIKTERMGSRFKVMLTKEYSDLNITFNNKDASKSLQSGGAAHSLVIQNMGDNNDINEPTHIDFKLL